MQIPIIKLLDVTKGIDVLVHAAFDHSYKSNVIGIKNIFEAMSS